MEEALRLGGVKSWSIQYDLVANAQKPGQPGRAAPRGGTAVEEKKSPEASRVEGSRPAAPTAAGRAENRTLQSRTRKTTGLFNVIESDGNPIQVVLLVSSFAQGPQSVVATVNRYGAEGRETVLFRALDIPAGGVARVELEGLAGDTIEVIFSLPSEELLPSVAVTKTFIADGAVVLQQLKMAADFVRM